MVALDKLLHYIHSALPGDKKSFKDFSDMNWAAAIAQVVAHQTTDREVLSLIPSRNWAFSSSLLFSFLSLNQWCFLKKVSLGGATLMVFNFPTKNGGLTFLS